MCRTVLADPRLISAHDVDVVIRKDGIERRIEADWIKKITKIVTVSYTHLTLPTNREV